jgi:hypothetical protein
MIFAFVRIIFIRIGCIFIFKKVETLSNFLKWKINQKNRVNFLIMFPKPKPMVLTKNWKPPNSSLQEMNINISLCSNCHGSTKKLNIFTTHCYVYHISFKNKLCWFNTTNKTANLGIQKVFITTSYSYHFSITKC